MSLSSFKGHRGALVSAVENILRNAIRHSPADSPVTVTLRIASGNAIIDVEDDGPGVPADELDHLFEPFFPHTGISQKDSNGGTGLGLAIARRAVELHHGRIEARNRDGGGLIVRITLPLSV